MTSFFSHHGSRFYRITIYSEDIVAQRVAEHKVNLSHTALMDLFNAHEAQGDGYAERPNTSMRNFSL